MITKIETNVTKSTNSANLPKRQSLNYSNQRKLPLLGLMLLPTLASSGGLRSGGIQVSACDNYVSTPLEGVLTREVMHDLGGEFLMPCLEEKLIEIHHTFHSTSFVDAVDYFLVSNHTSTDPFNNKTQRDVSMMGLILSIPQYFKNQDKENIEQCNIM